MKNNDSKHINNLKDKVRSFNKEYRLNLKITIRDKYMADLYNGKDHLYTSNVRYVNFVLDGMALQYQTNTIKDNVTAYNGYFEDTPSLSSLGIDEDKIWSLYEKANWIAMDEGGELSFFAGSLPPIALNKWDYVWITNADDDLSKIIDSYLVVDVYPPNTDWTKCLWKRPDNK